MLRFVDVLVVGFLAVLALALAVSLAIAIDRGRTLGRIRGLVDGAAASSATNPRPTGADPAGLPAVDLEDAVRDLQVRARDAEWARDQAARDRAGLIDIIGVGIVHLDDDLRVDVANATAHRQLGRAAGGLIGRTAIEAFIDTTIETIAASARETGAANGELAIRRDGGPTLVVRARRSPVRGVWLIFEDVSELRRLQRIRTEFIDNLSHELRTPLTTVSLLAETLVREAEEAGEAVPPRMRDRISKIEVETDHLAQMVSELLDLSRIESGGPLLLLDLVDLGRLATATTERLRLFADRQGVDLRAAVTEPVPLVRGAEDRLGQALVNLLHNAVKFSPDGGTVMVSVRAEGEEVLVAVEDHGIGIPKADQARIFERFYKADKARRRGAGTGLGLAIVRHVVEAHGGWIRVESAEGAGSTFSFGIPAVVGEDALPSSTIPSDASVRRAGHARSPGTTTSLEVP